MEIKLYSTLGHQTTLKQLTKDGKPSNVYILKTDVPTKDLRISKKDFVYIYVDCPGGPRIEVNKTIRHTDLPIVEEIRYNNNIDKFIIRFKQ